MMKDKPTAREVLHTISRLAAEAEWTDAEIDEALREDGIDPDELVRGVRRRLKEAGFTPPESAPTPCACKGWPSFDGPVDGVVLHHSMCDGAAKSEEGAAPD